MNPSVKNRAVASSRLNWPAPTAPFEKPITSSTLAALGVASSSAVNTDWSANEWLSQTPVATDQQFAGASTPASVPPPATEYVIVSCGRCAIVALRDV